MFGTSQYENVIVGILGKRGKGKTTIMKHFLYQELKKNREIIVYFPNDFQFYEKNIYKLIVDGSLDFREIATYLKNKMLSNKGELSLFIDEMDMIENKKDLDFIFNFSRNYRTNIFYVAKRTANISKSAVSQTDKFYVFQNTELNDLKRLKYINENLFYIAPKLKKFEAVIIKDNEIDKFIKIKFDISKLQRLIEEKLKKKEIYTKTF